MVLRLGSKCYGWEVTCYAWEVRQTLLSFVSFPEQFRPPIPQYSIPPLDVRWSLKSQIKYWTPSTLNQLPVHPGTGWYTLWYTLKVQKTQCLSALVRVVHLKPPLGIPHHSDPPPLHLPTRTN